MPTDSPSLFTSSQKRLVVAWCLFDFSLGILLSAFLVTFPLFFTHYLNLNPVVGAKNWELNYVLSAIIVAMTSPIFGLITDRYGHIKWWLVILSVLLFFFMLLLHWVHPKPDSLILMMVILISFALLLNCMRIVYNSILPAIAPLNSLGKVSFLGYLCAVFGCLLGMLIVIKVPDLVHDFKIYTVILPLSFFIFTMPLLILYCFFSGSKDKAFSRRRTQSLLEWAKELVTNTNVVYYLLARIFIFNGYTAFVVVFTIFVNGHFLPRSGQMIELFFVGALAAMIGGVFFAWLDDRIGAKNVLLIGASGSFIAVLMQVLSLSFTMFAIFFLISTLFLSALVNSMRSLLVRVAPQGRIAGLIGCSVFLARATSFISPGVYYLVQSVWQVQRLSLLLSLIFIPVGILFLVRVKEPAC